MGLVLVKLIKVTVHSFDRDDSYLTTILKLVPDDDASRGRLFERTKLQLTYPMTFSDNSETWECVGYWFDLLPNRYEDTVIEFLYRFNMFKQIPKSIVNELKLVSSEKFIEFTAPTLNRLEFRDSLLEKQAT
jgi:hypothetical protein